MSALSVYMDDNPGTVIRQSNEPQEIREVLAEAGIRFEQWDCDAQLEPGQDQDSIIQAYQRDIDRLIAEKGYQTVDAVNLNPDHPQKAEFREKFLSEHTHSEDEVRFFVAGQGLFSLHIDNKVYEVLCEQGDLISVPANTAHWFDMGENPNFIALRFFNNPEGWVANFTGSSIAESFNRLEN